MGPHPEALPGRRPEPAALHAALAELTARFGDRAVSGLAVRQQHSHGEGLAVHGLPDLVVYAHGNEDVAAVLQVCHRQRVPVVPFGAGSSLEGHVAALYGGVSLDLTGMDRVLDVSAECLDCRVQAGVTREALNAVVRDRGLFFSVDPGANATLGGMAATRASGTNTIRYGTMRENVLALTVVTPDGEVVRTGSRARKSSAGLDLTHLYVGSEGTLGVITELQLRLHPVPESIVAAVGQFPSLEAAVGVVVAALQGGLRVARIELLDAARMQACIAWSKLPYEALPTLFLEFHGSALGAREDAQAMQSLAADFGGSRFQYADRPEDRSRLWKARHDAYHATRALKPGCSSISTDVCVPIDALAGCLLQTQDDIASSPLTASIVGHVGDGNFHIGILFDRDDPREVDAAEQMAQRVARRALAAGGTCTGEHGIGVHKIGLLKEEHPGAVTLMRRVKAALDPHGIMNPGKLYPA